jgi:D-3-phosphoglycerate dehydrogenase
MSTRVLLTTCSFQDTPGPHHELLASQGYEVVRERGPLSEARMLELAGDFDAFLCGDDAITRAVNGPAMLQAAERRQYAEEAVRAFA